MIHIWKEIKGHEKEKKNMDVCIYIHTYIYYVGLTLSKKENLLETPYDPCLSNLVVC